jgi:pectate lyase
MVTDLRRILEGGRNALRERRQTLGPIAVLLTVAGIALLIGALLADDDASQGDSVGGGDGLALSGHPWKATTYYARDDLARYEGVLWRAKIDSLNLLPGPSPRVGIPQGFGANTTGGLGGEQYWVTTLADSGRGSLREGAERPDTLWIRFWVSGEIELKSPIDVASNKTIDGRGADVTLSNWGLILSRVSNVIVANLRFRNGRGTSTDAIGVREESHDIWIDHCDFADYGDGLVDITSGGTNVTVSWSKFSNQNKVMLINGQADDGHTVEYSPHVTLHHNLFENTYQRNPRALHGLVHAFNNYLRNWGGYGMRSSEGGQLFSQSNVFDAGPDERALLTQPGRNDFAPGLASSIGDLLGNEALTQPRLPSEVFNPARFYPYEAETANSRLRERILDYAGWAAMPYGVWRHLDEGSNS